MNSKLSKVVVEIAKIFIDFKLLWIEQNTKVAAMTKREYSSIPFDHVVTISKLAKLSSLTLI